MKRCPICGGFELSTVACVKFVQDEQGDMIPDLYNQDDINDQVTLPNNEFKCENPKCGIPFIDGVQIDEAIWNFNEGDTFKIWCVLNDKDYDVALQEYEKSDAEASEPNLVKQEYYAWLDSLVYEPWEGMYGDLIDG